MHHLRNVFACLQRSCVRREIRMFGNSPTRTKSSNYGQNYIGALAAAGLSGNFFLNVGELRDFLDSKLGLLQQRFLQAFFSREKRFYLTGGAALAGFHLGHRETHDLDLFTLMDVMKEGSSAVAEAASEMGAKLGSIQTSPDFRRYILMFESEAIVIDLVRKRVAQIVADKPVIGIVAVDPPEEILANKLCALLGRAEFGTWWMFALWKFQAIQSNQRFRRRLRRMVD
jgi:hypothetical protein